MTRPADNAILSTDDQPAFRIDNADGAAPILLICDHAANRIPAALGTLGLAPDALQSHAAWDPGAYDVASILAKLLDATLVSAGFSRLVYDVNRPPDSPEAIRGESEFYAVPGNRDLSENERRARVEAIYDPFHAAVGELIEERRASGRAVVLVSVHSFTPVYYGEERRVQIGVLHDSDARLADRLLDCAERLNDLVTLRNQPYGPDDGVTHTIARHALSRGLLNVMFEIRNDLIRAPAQQARIGELLARMLKCALDALGVSLDYPVTPGAAHASRD